MTWPVVAPVPSASTAITYGTYHWFLVSVGLFMGYGPNPDAWDDLQVNMADWIVQRGAQQFYNPPLAPGDQMPHQWNFLKINANISTSASDYDYDLPAGCSGLIEDLTYSAASTKARIELISELAFRAVVGKVASNTGAPRYAAVRPKALATTADQLYEVLMYPTPDATYTVAYRYKAIPAILTATNLYPSGTRVHTETFLQSMLSIAEMHKDGVSGHQHARFLERLSASVAIDKAITAQELGDTPVPQRNLAPSK